MDSNQDDLSLFEELLVAGGSNKFIARNHRGELIGVDYLNNLFDITSDDRIVLLDVWSKKLARLKTQRTVFELFVFAFQIVCALTATYGLHDSNLIFLIGGIAGAMFSMTFSDKTREMSSNIEDVEKVCRTIEDSLPIKL